MKKEVQEFADYYGMLDALIAADAIPDLQPGEVTTKIVAERAKCHHQQARAKIDRWVESGKLEYIGKRREPVRGSKVDAWRLKEQAKHE